MSSNAQDGTLLELNQSLSAAEIQALYEAIEEQLRQGLGLDENILKQIKKSYFHERLTRLEGLQAQVKGYLHAVSNAQNIGTYEHLKNVYRETYYQSAWELYNDKTGLSLFEELEQASSFIRTSFHILNDKAVEIAVSKPWSGHSFSKRIWKNNDKLVKELQQVLGIGLGQGHGIERMARELDFRMKQGYKNARRIVRTETNFVMSEANAEAYKASGVERYQFVAVLDYKTSEICQSLDGKIFAMEERKVGVNCNPMHPNCRSTTAPYTGRKIPTRIARGTDGKTYFVDGDINYKEWYENLAQTEKDKMQLLRTMEKNKNADLKQFEKYKEILHHKVPDSFERFVGLKYNTPVRFEELKNLFKDVKSRRIWKKAHFTSEKSLQKHFKKHVQNNAEFGIINEEDYLKIGRDLLSKKIDNVNILGFRMKSGKLLFEFRYDAKTNTLAIGRGDYRISTIFKPEDGMLYYIAEHEKYLEQGVLL